MSLYNKTITIPEQVINQIDIANLYPFNRIKVTSLLPVWFVNNTDVGGYSTYFEITPPLDGTYTYNVDVYLIDEPTKAGTAIITITVEDILNNIEICCTDPINIVWLNRQGGRANYIFTQRKDFKVDIGKSPTFISNGIIKYSERRGVYDGLVVYATGLSQDEVDYLDTLRYAIQAWRFNTDNTFSPILLDSTGFTKYNTKENMYEVVISFIYATELFIQKQ